MARCLIGCGSNLGRRREQLDRAVELLRFMPGVSVVAVSRYRETLPIGGPDGQPPFLNGACLIETGLPPHDILGMLTAVENTLHRERHEHWGPRTLDLDLLLYDDVVLDTPALTVPHPRMVTRRFVLEPAAEIAADLRHPIAGCTVQALLDNLSRPHPLVAIVGPPGSGSPEVAAAVADAVMARPVHAPLPLPAGTSDITTWRATLAAWERALDELEWHDDPHGTIADFALDMLRVAADDLPAAEAARFDGEIDRALARTVAPQVVILLQTDAVTCGERSVVGGRPTPAGCDAGFVPGSAALLAAAPPAGGVASPAGLQERLACHLRRADLPARPLAVLTIAAGDVAAACVEATAAVEAML